MLRKQERNCYMDVLNTISCFAVVVLHCTTIVYVNQGDKQWFISVILQSLFMFAVPVFFMISGANLIGYRSRYSTQIFFKKRFRRVCGTLVAYSFFLYALGAVFPQYFGMSGHAFSFFGFIDALLTNQICDVYWFLYAILLLYLITPLLSVIADNRKLLEYAITLSAFSTLLVPLINRFAFNHSIASLLSVSYLTGPILYYMVGYYLTTYLDLNCIRKVLVAIVGFCSLAVMAGMTIKTNAPSTVLSGNYAEYDNFYNDYLHPFVFFYSVSLFIAARFMEDRLRTMSDSLICLFSRISSLSFGVYAIHMLVIWTLDTYVPHSIRWDVFIRPLVVFAISIVISYSVEKAKSITKERGRRKLVSQ